MSYSIRMGVPEMQELWERLQTEYREGTISKADSTLYKKWGNALTRLSSDPFYPSLNTHEIPPLTKRYGMKVWQSYLEKMPISIRLHFFSFSSIISRDSVEQIFSSLLTSASHVRLYPLCGKLLKSPLRASQGVPGS